jgi:squalene-associated FAD-dependent desaturase
MLDANLKYSMTQHRIAIIGSGTSGLAAALRLAQSPEKDQFAITIFESRHIAGGRTRSYIDEETGDTLDNGQHLLMGCYSATWEYMRSIGTDHLVRERKLSIPYSLFNPFTSYVREAWLSTSGLLPAPLHALYGLLTTDLLSVDEKRAAIGLSMKVKSLLDDPSVKYLTCAELFREHKQSEGVVRKLWEPLVLATLNATVKEASAIPLLSVLKLALLGKRTGSSFLFPEVGLSELLIDPAVKLLSENGIEVKFKCSVKQIAEDLRITFADGTEETFNSIIVATPLESLEVPDAIKLPPIMHSPIVNAYFWVDRPLLREPIRAFVGGYLQWAFSKPSTFSGERIALTVSAAGDLSLLTNEEIARQLWMELVRGVQLPPGEKPRLVHYQIIKEKRATALLTPEAQNARPGTETNIRGLYLAGDFVQNMLPATIEGAIRNGFGAADLLLKQFS